MQKRLTVLFIPMFLLFAISFNLISAQSEALYDVIINEWSQGNGGSKEWVELLIVSGPADLRGWDLGDNSAGDLTFSNDALWNNVAAGTLIVIYNGGDRDTILPPDDADSADFTIILPDDNATYFSGNWPSFANTNPDDNPVLRDASDMVVHDYSTAPGGLHPGGGESTHYTSGSAMGVEQANNWVADHPASDATPGMGNGGTNSVWITALQMGVGDFVDLAIDKDGPTTQPTGQFSYVLTIENIGNLAAPDVVITDTLPLGLSYVADTSGFPVSEPLPNTLVWNAGSLGAGSIISFSIVVAPDAGLADLVVNHAAVATSASELTQTNNEDTHTTLVGSVILINAVHFDGFESSEDEAVQLINVSNTTIDIGGWSISDSASGGSVATFPGGITLGGGHQIWLTNNFQAFERKFGFGPDYDMNVLAGSWPGYTNTGDEVVLRDPADNVIDTLVYEGGNPTTLGWDGVSVERYRGGSLPTRGQILYRMRDQATGMPVPDTNTANDWAQSLPDPINGRKVRFPGWDLDQFFFTPKATESAEITIAIAPDTTFATVVDFIDSANDTIKVESLIITNEPIMDALVTAANRGVHVEVLLEGSPAGGLLDQERYLCQKLFDASGNSSCWFSINETDTSLPVEERIYDRYNFMHAKFIIVDDERVMISTDNFTKSSMPYDDFSDGTTGRRGAMIITDAPSVVAHLNAIWSADFDPANHPEIFPYTEDHPVFGNKYGAPPSDFVPDPPPVGITYTIRYTEAKTFNGTFDFEVVQSPDTSLRDSDSLLGMVNQAGVGDTVYVQQLNERPYWGPSTSNSITDPNPRLEAYIDAARRGADVWILLDEYHVINFYDPTDPPDNEETCQDVNAIARAEGLSLRCRLGLPADLGIHSKIVLAEIDGKGYVHIGSLNGSEQSSKNNREVALQVQSDEAFAYLADMFIEDWPHRQYLPIIGLNWRAPADYVLISEILYDSVGPDNVEFIELANPTGQPIDISNYSIGDAVNVDDFEDVRNFPPGTVIDPLGTIVVALQADAFNDQFGFNPDFEILNTDPAVPDLIDNPAYGDPNALLQLANGGDEVIFRDPAGFTVDAVSYGTGMFPGVIPADPVMVAGHSLERDPYWLDTDDGTNDFREQLFPSPGSLPD